MVRQQRDLSDLVKSAEVTLYADNKNVVVGSLIQDVRTGEEKVVRRNFLDDCETILTVRFSSAVKYETFAKHVYRYLRRKMPGVRRLKHQRQTKGDLGGTPEQYILEGSKGNETSVNCLNSGKNGYSEFTVCSNYFDAMQVLVSYIKNELNFEKAKTKTVIGLFG